MDPLALSQFAGVNNRLAAEDLNSYLTPELTYIDLVEAVNVDIDDGRGVARRDGQEQKVAGACHSLWSDGVRCLFVKAGELREMTTSFAHSVLASGLSSRPMAYVKANEQVYHSNGVETGVLGAEGVRAWGIPIDLSHVSAAAIAGELPPGIYQYALTLVREDGLESGAGIAAAINLSAGGGLRFFWTDPDDADIVDVAIYLSQPNGEVMHRALVLPVGNLQGDYIGGQRSLALATQWLDAPPAADVLALYNGRIYLGVGEFLYATAPHSYEHCDLRDYRGFDGTPIATLAGVTSGLFVGTARGVYFMPGASFADQSLKLLMDGAALRGTLTMVDGFAALRLKELAGTKCALFTTDKGVVAGLPDGSLINLSAERYELPALLSPGAAVFRQTQHAAQYLLCAPV